DGNIAEREESGEGGENKHAACRHYHPRNGCGFAYRRVGIAVSGAVHGLGANAVERGSILRCLDAKMRGPISLARTCPAAINRAEPVIVSRRAHPSAPCA